VEPDGIVRAEGSGVRLWPRGSGRGWGTAYSRPLISVRGRARSARSTEGEIARGGTRDETSRPKGGEVECLVDAIAKNSNRCLDASRHPDRRDA